MDNALKAAAPARWLTDRDGQRRALTAACGLLWLLIVVGGLRHHEFWRDEGRALSLALMSDTVWHLPSAIQGEGHPLLWYSLLRLAHEVWPSPGVLPLVSVLCGGFGVAVFLWRGPFPTWWKALFVFGALPLYEYAVMARNYGISMLLMFAFAAVLCQRKSSAVVLGGLLFLLAQTNVHSALLVPLLAVVWLSRWRAAPERPHGTADIGLGLALAGCGLLCTLLTVYPARHTLITGDLSMTAYAGGNYVKGIALAVIEPGHFFRRITLLPSVLSTLLLMAAAAGLVRRPWLLGVALLGLWANAALFALVYAGEARHQGVWFVFLISLYWIATRTAGQGKDAKAPAWRLAAFRGSLYGVLPVILMIQCATSLSLLSRDWQEELSKSAALAHAVAQDPSLTGALIVAQPDEFLEAIPYYLGNPTFLLRERKPGNTATWSLALPRSMSLGDDLQQIRQLRAQTGRPVVLILSHRWPDDSPDSVLKEDFGREFKASSEAKRELARDSTRLLLGKDALRENFDAYVFR